jgi:hypothetical protein
LAKGNEFPAKDGKSRVMIHHKKHWVATQDQPHQLNVPTIIDRFWDKRNKTNTQKKFSTSAECFGEAIIH